MKKITKYLLPLIALSVMGTGCNDFLDIVPPSDVVPENYFSDVNHLSAFCNGRYEKIVTVKGYAYSDQNTDNQISPNWDTRYTKDSYKVADGTSFSFWDIYQCNYFFEQVMPRYEAKRITGDETSIRQYIGEMYFFRAWFYFDFLQRFGDFPIITKTLPDDKQVLIENYHREPMTKVARFILSDLDQALLYLNPKLGSTQRINSNCAALVKSRVALYVGTWLKYFENTPFVPNGPDWPGAAANPDYRFEAGDIVSERNWFLQEAVDAANIVASTVALTPNNKQLRQEVNTLAPENQYLEMFGALSMDGYKEILLWKQFNQTLGISNGIANYAASGNESLGICRSLIDSYLMEDGLPTYASSSSKPYLGDNSIEKVITNRDNRMFLFVKQPGQRNGLFNTSGSLCFYPEFMMEQNPKVTISTTGKCYITGYACRKGWNPDCQYWNNLKSSCGFVVFRAAEAYLDYIEAYYELHGELDENCKTYWKAIRTRGGVSPDFELTISKTNMALESRDLGAYSRGQLLSDATLYNIRRERRVEMMLEGLRWMDLRRWRSFDQLMTNPIHMEGFKIWNSDMTAWYPEADYTSSNPNMSPPSAGNYLLRWEIQRNGNPIVDQGGCTWKMGHYLEPIGIDEFRRTSYTGAPYSDSPLYQNPYWGLVSNQPASN